jgi:thiol-disulfide isomerase/thioredoxin
MRTPRRATITRLAPLLVATALVAAACGSSEAGGSAGTGDTAPPATGTPAALASAVTVDNEPFDATLLDGRHAVAWFWAPWCVICRAEGPDVAEVAARFGDQVTVFGVAGRGELPAMQAFVADTGTASLSHVADVEGSIWEAYGVYGQPAFAFIDDDGSFDLFVGSMGATALAQRIDTLLTA